jgi:large subunit ribosomal protein L35
MGKVKNKTHKATAKRFKETATGKLKHKKQGDNAHLKINKNNREKRRKRKKSTLSNSTEVKKLKQLMHG